MRWKPPEEPAVLLGWGNHHRLVDLVKKIGTEEELNLLTLPVTCDQPASYRRLSICSAEEVAAFKRYATWLEHKVKQGEI